MVIIYILKLEKDKIAAVLVFSRLKRDQNVGEEKIESSSRFVWF